MKMRILLVLLVSLSAMSVEAALSNSEMPVPIERFITCFGEEAQKRYRVELVAMNDLDQLGANVIDLLFDYYGDLDLVKARKLIVAVTDAFLDKLAQDQTMAQYFCHFPLDVPDVTVKIRHRKGNCGFVYPTLENIEAVMLQDGKIYYETVNASTYAINVLRTETYDFAKEFINATAPVPKQLYIR